MTSISDRSIDVSHSHTHTKRSLRFGLSFKQFTSLTTETPSHRLMSNTSLLVFKALDARCLQEASYPVVKELYGCIDKHSKWSNYLRSHLMLASLLYLLHTSLNNPWIARIDRPTDKINLFVCLFIPSQIFLSLQPRFWVTEFLVFMGFYLFEYTDFITFLVP